MLISTGLQASQNIRLRTATRRLRLESAWCTQPWTKQVLPGHHQPAGGGGGLLTDSPPPQPGGQNIGPNLAPNMTLEGAYNNVAFSVNNLVQRNTTVHGVEFFVNEQRKEQ